MHKRMKTTETVKQPRPVSKLLEAPPPRKNSTAAQPKGRWSFLSNHAHVLIFLHRNPDLLLREVASRVGITERAAQRIVQELEENGFIQRERIGRRNHYRIVLTRPLRHPIESHRKIGDLLNLFG
jgi:DNA-binding MarR family transcriptional regulator